MTAIRRTLPRDTPIELWWQDEARVGQKNGIIRRWARRGTRPSAPKDQRTTSAYIYGAICPAEGKACPELVEGGAALVLPRCNTEGMSLHLAEISAAVAPGAHAVLLLDQAGWHGSAALVVPQNITLLPRPSKGPELNPIETVWQFMRDNWLSNRIFKSCDDSLDHCCFAWALFLPPCSPALNPTEMAFAKLKAHLQKAQARTIKALWQAVGSICELYSSDECWNYLKHAGYVAD